MDKIFCRKYRGINLDCKEVNGIKFDSCIFHNIGCVGYISLNNSELAHSTVSGIYLPNLLVIKDSKVTNSLVYDSNLGNLETLDTEFTNVIFRNTDFSGSIFSACTMNNVKFINCNISDVIFDYCNFHNVYFDKSTYNNSYLKVVSWCGRKTI